MNKGLVTIKRNNMAIKILEVNFPEYRVDREIEYDKWGEKIDSLLEESLEDGRYVQRSIGLIDHPNKTVDELTRLVLNSGTDKYDPKRKSIFDDEFSCYEFDIHGSEFELNNKSMRFEKEHLQETYYGQNIYCFHKLAKFDRGYSVRIGMSLIYNKEGLLPPLKRTECEERIERFSKYLYRFKDNKPLNSLVVIVKIK